MTEYWHLGRWGRLPVSMHWTALFSFAWIFFILGDVTSALIASVALFALFVLHEFGHVAMARWRRIAVHGIILTGMHGKTLVAPTGSNVDRILVAWGGVLAQALVLALSLAAGPMLALAPSRLAFVVAGPVLFVFIKWNLLLMFLALLPIGPMDGHEAWKVIPLIRKSFRKKNAAPRSIVPRDHTDERVVPLFKKKDKH